MGDLTYIQWRRTSDGGREVVVQTVKGSQADQKRYVVTRLEDLPESVAQRLREHWHDVSIVEEAP